MAKQNIVVSLSMAKQSIVVSSSMAKDNIVVSSAACIKKCCTTFSEMVGVPVLEADIEVAHRLGVRFPRQDRGRPIIVRFLSRKKKDAVLTNRRKLKGNTQKIAIGEDLTPLNYKLLKEAKEHSATLDAWSSNGQIFAKLKN